MACSTSRISTRLILWVSPLRQYSPGSTFPYSLRPYFLASFSPSLKTNVHRLPSGLQGSLIPFAPYAFVVQRQVFCFLSIFPTSTSIHFLILFLLFPLFPMFTSFFHIFFRVFRILFISPLSSSIFLRLLIISLLLSILFSNPVYRLRLCCSAKDPPISLVPLTFHIPLLASSCSVTSFLHTFSVDFPPSYSQPPTNPLRPILMNNTCLRCMTASAGTIIRRDFLPILRHSPP